jgi:hypothetical protein
LCEQTNLIPSDINFIQNTESINEIKDIGTIGYFIGWSDKNFTKSIDIKKESNIIKKIDNLI